MNSECELGMQTSAPRAAPRASDRCTSSIHNSEFTIELPPVPSPLVPGMTGPHPALAQCLLP